MACELACARCSPAKPARHPSTSSHLSGTDLTRMFPSFQCTCMFFISFSQATEAYFSSFRACQWLSHQELNHDIDCHFSRVFERRTTLNYPYCPYRPMATSRISQSSGLHTFQTFLRMLPSDRRRSSAAPHQASTSASRYSGKFAWKLLLLVVDFCFKSFNATSCTKFAG